MLKVKVSLRQLLWGFVPIAGVLAIISSAREAAIRAGRQSACEQNMRLIAYGLLNYHDLYACFPPSQIGDGDQVPALSWRTAIAPLMFDSKMQDEYSRREEWNSPRNIKAAKRFAERWDAFRCPDAGQAVGSPVTNYVMVDVPGGAADGVSQMGMVDGTSNTIVVLEYMDSDIFWTEPRDVGLEAACSAGVPHPCCIWAIRGDGDVVPLKALDAASLAPLLTAAANDGGSLDIANGTCRERCFLLLKPLGIAVAVVAIIGATFTLRLRRTC